MPVSCADLATGKSACFRALSLPRAGVRRFRSGAALRAARLLGCSDGDMGRLRSDRRLSLPRSWPAAVAAVGLHAPTAWAPAEMGAFFAVFAWSQVRAAGPGRCYGCGTLDGSYGRQVTGLAGVDGLLAGLHGAYRLLRQPLLRRYV